MPLFQRSLYGEDPSFSGLFRLLDDFESVTRGAHGQRGGRHVTFNPRFDVRETEAAYELHGELPGVERKDVQIEFTDSQTVVVRGRVERSYAAGTPPAARVEDATASGTAAEAAETASHKTTVSDEAAEAAKEKGEPTPAEVAQKPEARPQRFWHQERSVGEFQRAFSFPARVDESAVTASLSNGILTVTVPKATKRASRLISVD